MKNKYNVADLFVISGGNPIMSRNSSVSFKGNRDGISIHLNPLVDYQDLKQQLLGKLESARQFFLGAKVIRIEGKELSEEEKNEIKEIIHVEYGMILAEEAEATLQSENEEKENGVFEGIEEGCTKFIRATIRSGQRIIYKGNVVIVGDVNPGAEIIAEGNILVMGALRGLAHAGSSGNEKAFVAAYSLQPTQLRIADVIARSPDDEKIRPMTPELAVIKDDVLMIEPYLPNK